MSNKMNVKEIDQHEAG